MGRIGYWTGLVRYYHVLLSRLGMSHDDGGAMIAEMYKVEHLSDLTYEQLSQVCNLLEEQIKKAGGVLKAQDGTADGRQMARDKLRRQAKASCGGLLATQGKIQEKNWGPADWQVIMGTIYNASGKKEFDSLSNQELRALSFEFNKQRKALEAMKANISN